MPIQHFSLEKTTNYTPTPSIQLTNGNECKVLIAITVPTRNWKYIFKVRTDILISELRKQAIETYNLKEIDFLNHGLYLPPDSGKKGKFLQDEQYRLEGSKSITKRINSKHHQKRLLSAIKRDDIGRVTDLLEQGLDPNFQYPSSGVIPLGCAAELADPREMILQLVNAGAHLDYRDSDTMTALHRAAINGNFKAIEVFLELGQNPNVRDKNDLTPLYYACSEDIRPECIQRLLYDHAILGVTDDKGRQEIHQACLNGRSKTLKQLIIYGADLNAQVENHNTPLHLCVLADEMECLLLLLRYGALPTIINSSGQTPYELAILIERMNLAKILQNFDENLIEGIDQKPVYNKDRRPTIHGPRAVTRKPSKAMSVDRELPPTPYQRCLSFDMNDLRQITPKRINQYVFHNKVDFRTPDIARRNSVDKKEGIPKFSRRLNFIRQRYQNYCLRSIILERGTTGYGFIMQGSDNVYDATHKEVVDLITTTKDMLQLKIINFQQLPEIQPRVINGNHNNNNTNANLNHSNNNTKMMNRTSFVRADLRRRNTQRSTSVDMARINRPLNNKIIHSLKPFEPFTQNTGYSISHSQHHPHHHDDLSDSKWDSESDLLNISEITEISVNSMNDGNFKKIMNLNHKFNSNMNGKMRSIHSEPLLYQMKTETDHDNNDNNNHSCNDEEISTVPKTSINNNLILNGHEIDGK
ncbi:putative sh3 and multiple ankyrin repeat domains protein 1,2 (shank1,2) [Schistosoma mansoni]|uniref:putative sh3 and multiple ankyrin repeat domains protein 1,2 (shank1,2) n=1 Tax=Schistosoma mansoni TaxID=6183 RepID=UPI0001A63051|nr:putative sh3 and multiple ankyrin repeat domains protein 1,2 (shank1,2) [Schistosoma mansoni]|eukprot:XP_018652776.1 putative sh3 and multiple ankyrin repeat domains protein 1,2 (shank1,2) [Schistosoma mansoni]